MNDIQKALTTALAGPVYDRFDKSIVVSNAVSGFLLLALSMGSRTQLSPLTLSEVKYSVTVIAGALLMVASAAFRAYGKRIRAERLAAILQSESRESSGSE